MKQQIAVYGTIGSGQDSGKELYAQSGKDSGDFCGRKQPFCFFTVREWDMPHPAAEKYGE